MIFPYLYRYPGDRNADNSAFLVKKRAKLLIFFEICKNFSKFAPDFTILCTPISNL